MRQRMIVTSLEAIIDEPGLVRVTAMWSSDSAEVEGIQGVIWNAHVSEAPYIGEPFEVAVRELPT